MADWRYASLNASEGKHGDRHLAEPVPFADLGMRCWIPRLSMSSDSIGRPENDRGVVFFVHRQAYRGKRNAKTASCLPTNRVGVDSRMRDVLLSYFDFGKSASQALFFFRSKSV
jgi:hypothetical protein